MTWIILTIIFSHFISGSAAMYVMVKKTKTIRYTQFIMTVFATIVSFFQTVLIIQQIKKLRGNKPSR